MPRKSADSLAVRTPVSVQRRLLPPADLSEFQQAVWRSTVNSRPASWFGDEHLPILLQYVRHIESANRLQQQIEGFDAGALTERDDRKWYETLLRLRYAESQAINMLARSMRMTHQALYRGEKRIQDNEKASNENLPWRKAA